MPLSTALTCAVAAFGGCTAHPVFTCNQEVITAESRALCDAVIESLDRELASRQSMQVQYAVSIYGPRDGEVPQFTPPLDAQAPDRLQSVVLATVYRSGAVYRVREGTVWSRDPSSMGCAVTYTSDGIEYHTRFENAGNPNTNLMLDLCDAEHRVGPVMDAYGWRVFGQVAPLDYQYFMRNGAASSDLALQNKTSDTSIVTWRFLPDAPQTRMTATIDSESNALRGIQMDVYAGDANLPQAKLMLRKAIEFTKHQIGDQSLRGARLVEQLGEASEEFPPTWALAIVTPLSIEPRTCSADLVQLVPRANEVVQDTRFDIATMPQDARVNINGRIERRQAPFDGDIGWNLDRRLERLAPATPMAASAPQTTATVPFTLAGQFDAGDVLIGDEPARVAHDFTVRNNSRETWTVEQVVKSCGCITCDINKNSIAPGEDAIVSMAMVVPNPGRQEQSVAILFGDDRVERFSLCARGYIVGNLRVISSGFVERDGIWRAEIRAYWVESDPALLADPVEPLMLEEGSGGTLSFEGWTVIEPSSLDGDRPRRLFGRGTIQLAASNASGAPNIQTSFRLKATDARACSIPMTRFSSADGPRFRSRAEIDAAER